jgi:hypothetical protein
VAAKKSTHVPDKLEAYMLQVRHALFELICAPEESNIISVEAVDDIAIENVEGVTAEQIKSALSDENPLANRSVAFWKTIYNWCGYLLSENLDPAKLKLIVVSSGSFTPGSIPDEFAKAHSPDKAEEALNHVLNTLKLTAKGEKLASDECLPYIQYCLDAKNKEIVLRVIQLFSFDLHNGTYDETLKRRFNEQIIPPEYSDILLYFMLGWVTERVHESTKSNKPAFISKKAYNDALRRQMRSLNQNTILNAVSTKPDDSTTGHEVERHDTYIKQLEIIDLDAGAIYSAASDYLMASAEKTEWAKRGLVTDHSFDDYNDMLKRNWESNKLEVSILHSKTHTEEQQGQLLYSKCKNSALTIPLQGCSVPSFFGSGVLQSLANEPPATPQIGWHPNYSDILKESEENERD